MHAVRFGHVHTHPSSWLLPDSLIPHRIPILHRFYRNRQVNPISSTHVLVNVWLFTAALTCQPAATTPLNKTAYLSLPWKWGPIHSSCARGEGWWTSTALEHALAWYCGGSHSFCEYLSTETCPVLPRDTLSFRLPYLQLARSFCASCSYQYLVCVISDGIECWNHSKLEC